MWQKNFPAKLEVTKSVVDRALEAMWIRGKKEGVHPCDWWKLHRELACLVVGRAP